MPTRKQGQKPPRLTGVTHPNNTTPPGSQNGGNNTQGIKIRHGDALNPPFDQRMRRIGSPLNRTHNIKRGWIQTAGKKNPMRVNFLFNVPAFSVSSSVNSNTQYDADAGDPVANSVDGLSEFLVGMGTSTSIKLQYDRTYEMFSAPAEGKENAATSLGVFADVAAWYTYFGMIEHVPVHWKDGLLLKPFKQRLSYLFVGPKLFYYGFPSSLDVTFTHFTENMVPVRADVSLGFEILPGKKGVTTNEFEEALASADIPSVGGWFNSTGTSTPDTIADVVDDLSNIGSP